MSSEKLRRCHMCGMEKPLSEFYKDARNKDGRGYRCKLCSKARAKRDFTENREARKETGKAYRQRPEIRQRVRNRKLAKTYGISTADYESLLRSQGGVCAICRQLRLDGRGRQMPVDHDHESGRVRGILCDNCNRIIGLFQDNPLHLRSAARYLRKWAPKEPRK